MVQSDADSRFRASRRKIVIDHVDFFCRLRTRAQLQAEVGP
jgi:hypothetical protein